MSAGTLRDLMHGLGISDAPAWAAQVPLGHEPFPWQFETMQKMFHHERFADFSDAGTGKTYPMQMAAITYAFYGNKVCIIMPPTLCEQFDEELEDFFIGIRSHLHIHLLNESPQRRDELMEEWWKTGWPDILMMSYQMFKVYSDPRREFRRKRKVEGRPRPVVEKKPNPYANWLKKAGYNVLICDEAHALKNPGSDTHDLVWNYVTDTQGQYILYLATGSPSGNTPECTYGLIRLKNPEIYHSKRHFDRCHVILSDETKFRQVLGFKNLDELSRNLYKNAVRVSSATTRTCPEPRIIEVKVKLEPAHLKLYRQVIKERMLEIPDGRIDATNDSKMRQLAKQLISVPELYMEKKAPLNMLRRQMGLVIEGINPAENKIIIFAYYKATVAALAEHFKDLNPAVINGASSNKDAQRKKFLNDPTCRVIVVNWQSGGVGLNLQSVCHYMLFAEVPTVPKDAWQAIARADRSGQEFQVVAYFFRVMKTIAGKHVKTLLTKDQVNDEVVKDSDKRSLLKDLLEE